MDEAGCGGKEATEIAAGSSVSAYHLTKHPVSSALGKVKNPVAELIKGLWLDIFRSGQGAAVYAVRLKNGKYLTLSLFEVA
ncbi:hypothetical protein JQ779_23430 [Klebsiella pneumoniae]|nr:hypothetical protein [Klebsiella pneumoniae]